MEVLQSTHGVLRKGCCEIYTASINVFLSRDAGDSDLHQPPLTTRSGTVGAKWMPRVLPSPGGIRLNSSCRLASIRNETRELIAVGGARTALVRDQMDRLR
jgi:hypothetical protein